MKNLVWLLKWILKAAIFFTLFAFALNNQHEASVRFFFGTEWRAPMVLVVLAAFALGLALGVIAMAPRWWRQRQAPRGMQVDPPAPPATVPASADTPGDGSLGNIPRHGL